MYSPVIITEDVAEYRATVPLHVGPSDVVLEVGCAWGTTTAILARHCRRVVGVDRGDSLPTARARHPDLHFEQVDGGDIAALRALDLPFNKIYLDISGSRELPVVIELLQRYDIVFRPELTVVKSNKLKRLFARSSLWGGANA